MRDEEEIYLSDRRNINLIQIKNGFKDYYYIDSDYKVYNSKSGKYLKIDAKGCYSLIKENGNPQTISYNRLLKLVFGSTFVLKDVVSFPEEEWKQINKSHYFCSNQGRIKSNQLLFSKVLVPDLSSGYARVKIDIGNGTKNYSIHKLVALLFLEPPTEAFLEIHHLNFDRFCNKADNLIFITHENHAKLHAEQRRKDKSNE